MSPNMRLRLRIQRADLATVNTLWPVSETDQKLTIAKLLESIDRTFPLESDAHGLEEYVVEVAGFECLHYHEIGVACKDEDEVVVRPLTYAEVRSRTLMGRSQIDEAGRKLHDGVAFGRPLLTAPVRPVVRVRASKRKRDDGDDGEDERRVRFAGEGGRVEGEPLGGHATLLPIGDLEDEDDDEEDDGDFEDESDAVSTASSSSSASDSSEAASSRSSDRSSEDSSDDSSDSSSADSSSDDSSSDDSSSDESSHASAKRRPKTRVKLAEPKRHAEQSGRVQNVQTTKKDDTNTPLPGPLPHDGKPTTHSRNIRRRDSKKLAWLKSQNILPANADLKAFREWESTNAWPETAPPMTQRGESMDTSSVTLNGGEPKDKLESTLEADLAARRELLMQSIASGGIEIGANGKAVSDEDMDEGPEVQSNKLAAEKAALTEKLYQESIDSMAAQEAQQSAASNRRTLDVNSAERLLYGSLGVRTPKTQEQKDALQKKLAGTAASKKKSKRQPDRAAEEAEDAEEEVADWASAIDLRAVECVEEGVELCTPPFPFYKRWDPQYHGKKKNRNMSAYADPPRKRRRRNQGSAAAGTHYHEQYDKYNLDGAGDALDYDGDGADDSYWEEGALLDDQGEDDDYEDEDDLAAKQLLTEANASAPVDDFPPLPADPTTLPSIAAVDARPGDYVVYTEMALSPATQWQPQMLTRTVKLLEKDGEEGDGSWKTQAAIRDLPPKEYDEEGKRVYGKFEMAGLSDDEDGEGEGEGTDERVKVLGLGELGGLRLLMRGGGE